MQSLSVASLKKDTVDSAIVAGTFFAIDKLYYKETQGCPQRALACGACHAGSELVKDSVHSFIQKTLPAAALTETTLTPVLTGALYVGLNKAYPVDYKSPMMQFFHSAGSAYLGDSISPQVRAAIKM